MRHNEFKKTILNFAKEKNLMVGHIRHEKGSYHVNEVSLKHEFHSAYFPKARIRVEFNIIPENADDKKIHIFSGLTSETLESNNAKDLIPLLTKALNHEHSEAV